jgi:hypothetical protein
VFMQAAASSLPDPGPLGIRKRPRANSNSSLTSLSELSAGSRGSRQQLRQKGSDQQEGVALAAVQVAAGGVPGLRPLRAREHPRVGSDSSLMSLSELSTSLHGRQPARARTESGRHKSGLVGVWRLLDNVGRVAPLPPSSSATRTGIQPPLTHGAPLSPHTSLGAMRDAPPPVSAAPTLLELANQRKNRKHKEKAKAAGSTYTKTPARHVKEHKKMRAKKKGKDKERAATYHPPCAFLAKNVPHTTREVDGEAAASLRTSETGYQMPKLQSVDASLPDSRIPYNDRAALVSWVKKEYKRMGVFPALKDVLWTPAELWHDFGFELIDWNGV